MFFLGQCRIEHHFTSFVTRNGVDAVANLDVEVDGERVSLESMFNFKYQSR